MIVELSSWLDKLTPAAATPPTRPSRYVVVTRRAENSDTMTLLLRPVDHPIPAPLPGQFTMLYADSVGEVPVPISGISDAVDPRDQVLVHTIRAAGAVTRALCDLFPGDTIGVRGPFGTDWQVGSADGRDMLIVADGTGLASLRPVLLTALARRARYDRVVLLAGARSAADLIFRRELDLWRSRGADVRVTVETGTGRWNGRVGPVTALIPDAIADPAGTAAFVCGQEVMLRLAADTLVTCGVPAADIRASLERTMSHAPWSRWPVRRARGA